MISLVTNLAFERSLPVGSAGVLACPLGIELLKGRSSRRGRLRSQQEDSFTVRLVTKD